jgi:pyruvate kinase
MGDTLAGRHDPASAVWGVHCVYSEDAVNLDDMVDRACIIAY